MLVLSRQRDETTVVDIRGDKVRIGIKAPAHVAVHRKEIYDAIRRENEQAACLRSAEFADQALERRVNGLARKPKSDVRAAAFLPQSIVPPLGHRKPPGPAQRESA
jgi:carbon storage regulator